MHLTRFLRAALGNRRNVRFGNLTNQTRKALAVNYVEQFAPEDADNYGKPESSLEPRKNDIYYRKEIGRHSRQGKLGLKRALELFKELKENHRVTPQQTHFSCLLYACAKAGYTKKAFELYEESLRYQKKPTNSQITCLINACAESAFPEYGIQRLDWFLTHLQVNFNRDLNQMQYCAAIKAYGRLGNMEKASALVQDMVDKRIEINDITFNMLLMGCAANKEMGCTLALRLYKRMRFYEIPASEYTFGLMLRCIRDCDLGTASDLQAAVNELPQLTTLFNRLSHKNVVRDMSLRQRLKRFDWAPVIGDIGSSISQALNTSREKVIRLNDQPKNRPSLVPTAAELLSTDKGTRLLSVPSNEDETTLESSTNESDDGCVAQQQSLPNLLSDDHYDLMHRIEAIKFDLIKGRRDRLLLFGGLRGYLSHMREHGVEPSSKTFSLILPCIPQTREDHEDYFNLTSEYKIKRDNLFYTLFLRNICGSRIDDRLNFALGYLDELQADGLRPDITTFESLAGGCTSASQARRLIGDLERCGLRVSQVLMFYLFEGATMHMKFGYWNTLIKLCQEKGYVPSKSLLVRIEKRRSLARDTIYKHEKGWLKEQDYKNMPWLNEENIAYFNKFEQNFKVWLDNTQLAEEPHPWEQFHVDSASKKDGYIKFVRQMSELEAAKQERLKAEARDLDDQLGDELESYDSDSDGDEERRPSAARRATGRRPTV